MATEKPNGGSGTKKAHGF